MPPRKGKGIVKTGNSGNSSKSSPLPPKPPPDAEKPLFPPGSKTPLNLLNERCQKEGWDRAIVDVRQQSDGWSFRVTLSRLNKKTSTKDTVRLEPHPPYLRPTALEARHWGATYALYRFCNGIQLNRILPPGPRDYWSELATEHKKAEEHQKWMYDADPFAARDEVAARQAKSSEKRVQREEGPSSSNAHRAPTTSGEFSQAPEAKMASGLRDLVEDVVKKAISLHPEAAGIALDQDETQKVVQQLGHLGFTPVQLRNVTSFLSKPSSMASNLLGSLSPMEAAIEYLILHVPECDLPKRFLPDSNSSNPFITSAHSGTGDLKRRWIEDKAVKEAGWPAHVVKECTSDSRLIQSWELLTAALGKRLLGHDVEDLFNHPSPIPDLYSIDAGEADALGATFEDETHLLMPMFSAPLTLHVLISGEGSFPRPGYAPMYLTSPSIPAYVRLHLLSQLLTAVDDPNFVEPGEGFCMAAMRILEDGWAQIEESGPPDISLVLQHVLPRSRAPAIAQPELDAGTSSSFTKGRRKGGSRIRDDRNDVQVRNDFETLARTPEYKKMLASREKLPAFTAKEEFLEQLSKSRVVVVVGETGCGKTTQLPQFILDSLILSGHGARASIIVTQPRRISAIGVAGRVSSERLDDGSVGYAIRGENKQTKRTKLLFCTTGVVLRRLGSGDSLDGVTHMIVDEVHERSIDGDFLLLELKHLLKRHTKLKVILMSATINHETFIKYFDGAPLLSIPGFTHPVTDMYLEDVIRDIDYRPPFSRTSQKKDQDAQKAFRDQMKSQGLDDQRVTALQNITSSERLDFQLIAAVVKHIVSAAKSRGGVLIFLPGVQEIRQCLDAIRSIFPGDQADILPLHANLSNDEQRRVFAKTSKWKIIAATNVAETSITIDDVIYVIDSGKVKEAQYDPESGLSRLVETWVTRAAARQRRGRAGRTQPGICYKLYTRHQEGNMSRFPVPEILRVPLETISLTVKVMREEEDVKHFLSQAIDPPKVAAMDKAWTVLEELGAVDEDGKLTALGRHIVRERQVDSIDYHQSSSKRALSMLPVDLRLAKMLVLGAVFRCLGPILTIAGCLSSKSLFISPVDKREEANQARARFSNGGSDLLTDLKAYDECLRLRTEGKPPSAIRHFCEDNFISPTTFREVSSLRQDFINSLADLGFIPLSSTPSSPSLNINSANNNLLKSIILGGLYPRLAKIHLPKNAIKFDKVQAGTVQRPNTAKEFKMFDINSREGGRVFMHPSSILFAEADWKSAFVVYFQKQMTSKVFLRNVTQVPLYALLLFGGPVTVNHVAGGLTVGSGDTMIKIKAWPRIGILVNQLRRLLDAQLQKCIEDGTVVNQGQDNAVLDAMLALLTHDGLTE